MKLSDRGYSARRTPRVWVAMAMLVLSSAPASAEIEWQTVLRPGDQVPGLGIVGIDGLSLIGVDDRGRALVARSGSGHGSDTFYWADGNAVEPLLDAPSSAVRLDEYDIRMSGAGAVGAYATPPFGEDQALGSLYAIVDGQARRVVSTGQTDAQGNTICRLDLKAINDRGEIALAAAVVAPGQSCPFDVDDAPGVINGLYLHDGELRRLDGPGSPLRGLGASWLDLRGVTADGAAVVYAQGEDRWQVALTGPSELRIALDSATLRAPDGRAFDALPQILLVDDRGGAVFRATLDGTLAIYRTDGSAVRQIIAAGEATPLPSPPNLEHAWVLSNTRGDVLLGADDGAALLIPADGTASRLINGEVTDLELSTSGDVGIVRRSAESALVVSLAHDGSERRLIGTGDPLPDGGALVRSGITAGCLAADGSIGAVALTPSGDAALVCSAGDEFSPVVRRGDPTPIGRRFYRLGPCAFTGPGEIAFFGDLLVPTNRPGSYRIDTSLFRATAARVERLVASGDVTTSGSSVRHLPRSWTSLAQSNAAGDMALLALTSGGMQVLLRHADGRLESVPMRLFNSDYVEGESFPANSFVDHEYLSGRSPVPAAAFMDAGPGGSALTAASAVSFWVSGLFLTESGALFILASEDIATPDGHFDFSREQVFLFEDGELRRLFAEDDAGLAGGPYLRFEELTGAGEQIAFRAWSNQPTDRILTYARGDTAPRVVVSRQDPSPLGPLAGLRLNAIDSEERVFFGSWFATGERSFVSEDGAVSVTDWLGFWPGEANQRGNVLFASDDELVRSGPGAAASTSCPAPPTVIPATPTETPTPRPGPTYTTPLPFVPATCAPDLPCIALGHVRGAAGARASMDVFFETQDDDVVAIQNDLVAASVVDAIDCRVNPAIDKEQSSFSDNGERLRALVIAFDNLDPLPAGVLYTCDLTIAAGAAVGHHLLRCAMPGASSRHGDALPVGCADSVLTVDPPNTPTPTPREGNSGVGGSGGGSSSGCAIDAHAAPSAPWPAFGLLLLGLAARRRRRPGG